MASPQSRLMVRAIAPGRILTWLALGWRDLSHAPAASLAHGLAIAGFGALLAWFAHDRFWLLAGAFSGFLVVAPLVATGLYALSRALERGESADFALLARTWTRWGANRRSDPSSYWCLVRFGLLLALAGTGWVLVSASFVTLTAPLPVDSPLDFVRHVVLYRESLAFEAWLVLGGALAAPMFASSVISMPLLLDRHLSALDAVLASWRVVLANPGVMALWAGTLMLITLLGFATLLAGLVVAIPLLGHASWHAYRDLVDASGLPERIAPEARA